jgi:hypothetical protein
MMASMHDLEFVIMTWACTQSLSGIVYFDQSFSQLYKTRPIAGQTSSVRLDM